MTLSRLAATRFRLAITDSWHCDAYANILPHANRNYWITAERSSSIPRKRGETVPEIHYLEKDQIAAIMGAVAKDTPLGYRDYTLLLLMYNSGARVQEVADAQTTWLSLTKPYKVEILGKGRKWRTCPLWESTVRHLKQLVEQPAIKADGHLFVNRLGHPLSRSGIANIIHRHAKRAAESLPSLHGINVTPHTLRHTTAMHLLQSNVEVNVIRSWLGHVSIATTNHYIEIDLAMKAKALEVCELGLGRADSRVTDIRSRHPHLARIALKQYVANIHAEGPPLPRSITQLHITANCT